MLAYIRTCQPLKVKKRESQQKKNRELCKKNREISKNAFFWLLTLFKSVT